MRELTFPVAEGPSLDIALSCFLSINHGESEKTPYFIG